MNNFLAKHNFRHSVLLALLITGLLPTTSSQAGQALVSAECEHEAILAQSTLDYIAQHQDLGYIRASTSSYHHHLGQAFIDDFTHSRYQPNSPVAGTEQQAHVALHELRREGLELLAKNTTNWEWFEKNASYEQLEKMWQEMQAPSTTNDQLSKLVNKCTEIVNKLTKMKRPAADHVSQSFWTRLTESSIDRHKRLIRGRVLNWYLERYIMEWKRLATMKWKRHAIMGWKPLSENNSDLIHDNQPHWSELPDHAAIMSCRQPAPPARAPEDQQ